MCVFIVVVSSSSSFHGSYVLEDTTLLHHTTALSTRPPSHKNKVHSHQIGLEHSKLKLQSVLIIFWREEEYFLQFIKTKYETQTTSIYTSHVKEKFCLLLKLSPSLSSCNLPLYYIWLWLLSFSFSFSFGIGSCPSKILKVCRLPALSSAYITFRFFPISKFEAVSCTIMQSCDAKRKAVNKQKENKMVI